MPEEMAWHGDGINYADGKDRDWTESEEVLAWDSMYGPIIDSTRNGKWVSETRGGYTGQVVHGIVAWMPIPEMDIEDYKL